MVVSVTVGLGYRSCRDDSFLLLYLMYSGGLPNIAFFDHGLQTRHPQDSPLDHPV